MVTVAVVGILTGTVIVVSGNEWRRQRVNAVAQELAGWLAQVRSASQRLTGAGCLVAFSASGTYNAGDVIAQIKPSTSCIGQLPETQVRIPNSFNGTSYAISRNADELQFTPRGTVTATSAVVVGITIANSTPQRCVEVSPLVAMIRLGRNENSNTATGTCTYSDVSPF
jgi:Tfp pilus assembly protein FimT